ncbi:hypothetical protein BGZ58_007656 [Dissophora ornata]|nr:hypothetical protein BGZ58_007656 [Dissophora ornata]
MTQSPLDEQAPDEVRTGAVLAPLQQMPMAGLKLIQQAYEDKYQALVEEVNTWKWISEEQSAQAIVSMVDQHSGVSLSQLEQSILETIEADAENGDAGYDTVADADTSSFILDGGAESIAPLSQQPRFAREDIGLRDQKAANTSTMSILPSFKSSPQSTLSRPRASTEVSAKRSGTAQHTNRQPVSSQSSYSPSRQSGSSAVRSSTGVLSDSAQNGVKKIQKSDSVDSLRSKRNTISTSSRLIYPNTFLSASSAGKRHSNVSSPLSPRAQAIIASSRAAASSTSFSSNSTPSTSPRQLISGTSGSATTGTMAARTARQHQQQKEYNIGVRNTTSHMASLSGVASLSAQSDRRAVADTTFVQRKASNSSISQAGWRSQRSGSESLSVNGLSPAALKLLRQQEKQQQLEEENEYAQKSSAHNRHGSHHYTDDEDHKRSTAYAQARSSVSGSSHAHQRNASEPGHESSVHPPSSGYESSSKYQKEGTQHRQNAIYGEKADTRATGTSNGSRPPQSTGGVDASAFTMLYKEIRDSMDTSSFGMFARVVTSFNEGEKTTDETLDEVGKIVKDRVLNQRFRDLIHQAIAEKENQQENEGGNETMEGDLTLEIDQSLLLDDDSIATQDRAQALEHAYVAFSREKDDEREANSMQNPDESMLQGDERDEEADQSLMDGEMLESGEILDPRKDVMSSNESSTGNTESGVDEVLQKSTRKQTI